MSEPIRVLVTGAAGQIAYSLLYSIGNGSVFGKDQVIVVGNPANTNCLTASKSAPSIPKENFSCLTRLDHNRAKAQIALKLGVTANDVKNVIIWGNHSSTQYPDVNHAKVKLQGKEVGVYEALKDDSWLKGEFVTTVQQRGAAVIKARKLSSAMSAAKAICDHVRDIWFGTPEGEFVSMGVISDGNSYGVPDDLLYSFPVVIKNKTWKFVEGLPINDFSREKMDLTAKELTEEKESAFEFLSSA